MAPHHYEDFFASKTPPSDFDDFDPNTMLACSPALPNTRCLTPDSLHQPHASSTSSNLMKLTASMDMASFQNDDLSQEMYFSNSSNSPFYPLSVPSLQDVLSFSTADEYNDFEQQQWIPMTSYSEAPSLISCSDAPPSTIFPTFDTPSISSGGNFIPQFPQTVTESSSFNFNTIPQHTLQSQSYLAASPAFSQDHSARSHSQSGSIPSLSRSCSPNPSLGSGNTPARSSLSTSTAASSSSNNNLGAYGILIHAPGSSATGAPQTWRCAYPGCTSRAVFTRGCDLRKHYNRHSKHLFCRVDGCPQSAPRDVGDGRRGSISATGGFSSKKDRARHEAKHNPGIRCEWQSEDGEECGRVFSRMDNMKDHVRRIHRKGSR